MRPLISIEFSSLSSYFSFSKSRRTPSPFTNDEEATTAAKENSSSSSNGLRSNIGAKLCNEKPYDGPQEYFNDIHLQSDNRHHISKPNTTHTQRGYRDVRTHRSRIESYSPDLFVDPLKAHPPSLRNKCKPP
ncbi:MAG: hypothetical protein Q9225_005635, partial [Loekoesia sp. 1 TL-2023]